MALAKENSTRSLVASSSFSYALKEANTEMNSHPVRRRKSTHTTLLQSLFTLHLHDSSLIRNGRNELVVNKDNRIELDTTLNNEVCDTSSISKSGNIPADLVESDVIARSLLSDKLTLGLVTNDGNGRVWADFCALGQRRFGVAGEGFASSLRDGGVNTTAKTLVGRYNDEEFCWCWFIRRSVGKDLCRKDRQSWRKSCTKSKTR